jgi:glutamine cyclotransferase
LLAPEIVGLEFRYFDGSAWANEWDSDEMQYFPTAIEVILTIDASRLQTRNGGRNQPADIRQQLSGIQQFRTVVHLPAAEAPAEEDE